MSVSNSITALTQSRLTLAEMPTCSLIQAVNPHDIFHQADTNN